MSKKLSLKFLSFVMALLCCVAGRVSACTDEAVEMAVENARRYSSVVGTFEFYRHLDLLLDSRFHKASRYCSLLVLPLDQASDLKLYLRGDLLNGEPDEIMQMDFRTLVRKVLSRLRM